MLQTFRRHLAALKLSNGVDFWADPDIHAGSDWEDAIRQQIVCSDWFVLLLSPNFVFSDYIMNTELPAIRKRRDTTHGFILPVVLFRCAWEDVVSELQCVPTDNKGRLRPIANWSPRNDGFDRARRQIRATIEHYYGTACATGVPAS